MVGKTKMNNKKLASEFAIGIILLIVIIIGGIFWVQNKKQEMFDDAEKGIFEQSIKAVEKEESAVQPIEDVKVDDSQVENSQQDLTAVFEKSPCAGHLYEGETILRGRYVLDTTYNNEKEWLFRVAKEDMNKLPIQIKFGDGRDVNELLKIADATPEIVLKLKEATDENPETITIKGYYLYCEGSPIVSIEPARLALAKYVKK